jgi:peptidoglycan/LPS O-acetylase OafA/YrhL
MIEPVARSTYVPHIDGLRAVAVLSVIVYHLNAAWLPGGLAGVDIFFVISGFVVSASLAEFKKTSAASFFAYFYARRIVRIMPALVVCLLVTHVATMLLVPYAWLSDTNQRTGLYAFVGLSNFILADTSNSYFSPKAEFNPYTHTWSLGVEEQFYLIFPPLFLAWIAGGRARGISSVLFALGFIGSLIAAAFLMRTHQELAFYMLYTRFWELAAGALLYQALVYTGHSFSETHRPATLASQGGAIVSALAVVAGLAFAAPRSFPYPGALLPVAGAVGLLAFLHGREPRGLVMRTLRIPAVVFIGQISYSLYLWHWPVFVLLRWTTGLESIAARVAGVVLTFALAIASYYAIERPPRRILRDLRVPRAAIIGAGIVVIAIATFVATKINALTPVLSLTHVGRDMADWYPGDLGNAGTRNCKILGHVEPLATSSVAIWKTSGCTTPMPAAPRLFVIGDSHAEAYSTMLALYAADTGAEVYKYANGGCPFVSLQLEREGYCKPFADAAVADALKRMRAGDVLFLPSLRLNRLTDQDAQKNEALAWQGTIGASAVAMRKRAVDEAVATLAPFAALGVRIVLEAPKPLLRVPPFRCTDWFNEHNPVCAPGLTIARADVERFRAPVLQAFDEIAHRVPNVSVFDPLPLLCDGGTCSAGRDGRPLFYDGDHISGYANRMMAPAFERWIGRLDGDEAMATPTP